MLAIKYIQVADLIPYARNSRTHSDELLSIIYRVLSAYTENCFCRLVGFYGQYHSLVVKHASVSKCMMVWAKRNEIFKGIRPTIFYMNNMMGMNSQVKPANSARKIIPDFCFLLPSWIYVSRNAANFPPPSFFATRHRAIYLMVFKSCGLGGKNVSANIARHLKAGITWMSSTCMCFSVIISAFVAAINPCFHKYSSARKNCFTLQAFNTYARLT